MPPNVPPPLCAEKAPQALPPGDDPGPAQARHRGVPAVQRLVEYAPGSGGLALWCSHRDVPEAAAGALAAPQPGGLDAPVTTDGRTLFYAPAFERLPLPVQAGWVAHGVLHIALRHAQRLQALRSRLGDVDTALFNLCADAIVNTTLSHLSWLALPAGALRLEQVLAAVVESPASPEAALEQWDVERLYRAVDDRRPAPPPPPPRGLLRRRAEGGDARADGHGGASASGAPGTPGTPGAMPGTSGAGGVAMAEPARRAPLNDGPRAMRLRQLGQHQPRDLHPTPADAEAPEAEAGQARDWADRLLRAHADDGVFSMWRALGADLPRTRTPWELVLRTQVARALSVVPAASTSRPTRSWIANQGRTRDGRRWPWEPGTTTARRVPRLAVVLDVSGSIDAALLERFAGELRALTRRLQAPMVLVVGDVAVRAVQHFAPGRGELLPPGAAGGGGTDFTPLLEEAGRHRPDLIVVLTDLDGPARHRPAAPVWWAVPASSAGVAPPFGRVLVLD